MERLIADLSICRKCKYYTKNSGYYFCWQSHWILEFYDETKNICGHKTAIVPNEGDQDSKCPYWMEHFVSMNGATE